MNFAVTGFGRSGTMFLARALNTDARWQVEHEPTGGFHPTREIRERFNAASGNYGEVNSWLRYCFTGLHVDQKRVILRDPHQILQSVYNRGRVDLPDIVRSLHVLDGIIQSGVPAISFARMTTDPTYLRDVGRSLGVTIGHVDLRCKVNCSSFQNSAPAEMVAKIDEYLGWFTRDYGDLL